MIVGIGLDIVSVDRIRKACTNPRFLIRILTPAERALGLSLESVAGRWAAKEAFAKAAGRSLSWQDVEILNVEFGRPELSCTKPDLLPGSTTAWVSISHERGMAAAVVVLEGGDSG